VDCSCFLANAAVAGDVFSWHVDADPQSFPQPTAWSQQYGMYCNRCACVCVCVCVRVCVCVWRRDGAARRRTRAWPPTAAGQGTAAV
jgi:hypothetical protein